MKISIFANSFRKFALKAVLAFAFLSILISPANALAQSLLDSSFTANDVSVELSPEIPAPNQTLTISLTSYTVDLDKARMTWTQDGKIKNSGTGIKEFSVQVGDVGSTTTIDVSIVINGLNRFDKRIVVSPSEVDMLWEAVDSYVPPFYEGKALPSSEAVIKVVAIPNNKTNNTDIQTGNFVYNWKKNFAADQSASGFSKNSYVFKASYLNAEETISANAASVSGNSGGEGSVTIVTGKPKIIFYEDAAGIGPVYASALNQGYRLTNNEATVVAVPYFFSVSNPAAKDLLYRWSINNNNIDTPSPANTLVIKSAGETGQAKVGLHLESASKLFQSIDQTFFVDIIK